MGKLPDHAKRHKADFGASSESAYEAKADAFLGVPLPCGIIESERCRNGDLVRYDPLTNTFGVMDAAGHILTFYKPSPSRHLMPSNAEYFISECVS